MVAKLDEGYIAPRVEKDIAEDQKETNKTRIAVFVHPSINARSPVVHSS